MVFEILQARRLDDAADPLYPLPGAQENSFVLEPDDGDEPWTYDCTTVIARTLKGGTSRDVGRAERIRGTVTITDSRFVFACTAFRTGGGYRGYGAAGALVGMAANAVSRAAAARETAGFTLVGHVRHAWLAVVTAQHERWGSKSGNALSLLFADPTEDAGARLIAYLPKSQSTAEAGRELVKRAARFKAARETADAQARLLGFANEAPSEPLTSGNGVIWKLPGWE